MQDKTINSALLALRKQIIRSDGKGLKQVETLLRMRDIHMPRVLPPRRKDTARSGFMTAILLEALRDGPMTLREATAYVAKRRPELDPDFAYGRTLRVLVKLKAKGLVCREGRLWQDISQS